VVGRSDLQIKIRGASCRPVVTAAFHLHTYAAQWLTGTWQPLGTSPELPHAIFYQGPLPCLAGVRLDLSEVEACLERVPDVAEAAAKAWPGLNGAVYGPCPQHQ